MANSFEAGDYKFRLRDNLIFLSESTTNREKILRYLIQEGVIDESERELILAPVESASKNEQMYQLIIQKGQKAYEILCKSLAKSSNSHILEALNTWKPKEKTNHARDSKLREMVKHLSGLHPSDVQKLNVMLSKERSSNALQLKYSDDSSYSLKENIQRDVCSQTESDINNDISTDHASRTSNSEINVQYPQYVLHDEKIKECPIAQPTVIVQLYMYHVEMDGSTFRKFLKLIRGLKVFKYFSFSPGGEISLLDLDLLHDCNLLELTFKNVNLFFDGRIIQSFQNISDLHLWMCALDEDFVDCLSTYFPVLDYIVIRGCTFAKQGGINASDFKNLLGVSHLKRIYLSPWTNPAFHDDVSEILKTIINCPLKPWTLYIKRAEKYNWLFSGYDPQK